LFGGCPHLGRSVKGGSTIYDLAVHVDVYQYTYKVPNINYISLRVQ